LDQEKSGNPARERPLAEKRSGYLFATAKPNHSMMENKPNEAEQNKTNFGCFHKIMFV
jgi:hypothetical protein